VAVRGGAPLAISDDLAVVRGATTHTAKVGRKENQIYANLWLIWFGADGRVQRFEEWWMLRPS
jgi:hypothetical protein